MTPCIAIRSARSEDLDVIDILEQRCFAAEAFSRRQLRYLLTQAQGACLVATCEGVVAGYISLLTRRTAGNLRIYSVAVAPEARGCGAGQALLDAAVAWARQHELSEVTLEVRTDNAPAIGLYTRNGFHTKKTLPGYYPDGTDAWQMVLEVDC